MKVKLKEENNQPESKIVIMKSKEKVSLSWGWDNYGLNVREGFRELLNQRNFADVTLLSGDCQKLEAHRVILSIGSPFFEKVLEASSQAHPCLYLKGVDHEDLVSVLQFMYGGEVEMTQDRLHKFVGVSQELQIKGFANVTHYQGTSPAENDNHDHVVICGEPGEIGETMGSEHDSAIDVDSMLEVGKESIQLQNEGDDEELVDISSDESLGQVEETPVVQELKTIDEIIKDKMIKDKANCFRCKECNFMHKRSDVTRDHIEEHHLETGGAECPLCHKVCKTREKLRRHMYSHQKRVSRASLCPSAVN